MIWIATQEYDFMDGGREEIIKKLLCAFKKEHPSSNYDVFSEKIRQAEFLIEPSEVTIRESFKKEQTCPYVVITSVYPEDKGFSKKNIFSIIPLRGEYFPLTKSDVELGLDEEEGISTRLVLKQCLPKNVASATTKTSLGL